jgi:hypothetical protein
MLAALVAPSPAGAAGDPQGDAQIVCIGPLPFSQTQAEEALRARRPVLGARARIEVQAGADGQTLVRVGSAERQVDWDGRSGEEAARLVAVLAEDLAQAGEPMLVSAGPPPAPRTAPALWLGLTLRSPFDQDAASAHVEPTLDVAMHVARGFGAFVAAGYRRVSAGAGFSALTMDELPVRAGIAYRRRWFDVRLGGVARPYLVRGAGAHQGMTWGVAASAAARWPLAGRWSLLFAAGLDLLASRAVFSVNEQPTLSTAWVAPWLGAGLAWESSR